MPVTKIRRCGRPVTMLRLRFAIGIFLAANGSVEAMAQQCDLSGRSIFYRSKYCVSTLCYNTSVTPFGSVTLEGAKGIDKSNYATFGAGGGVSVGFTFTNAKKIS